MKAIQSSRLKTHLPIKNGLFPKKIDLTRLKISEDNLIKFGFPSVNNLDLENDFCMTRKITRKNPTLLIVLRERMGRLVYFWAFDLFGRVVAKHNLNKSCLKKAQQILMAKFSEFFCLNFSIFSSFIFLLSQIIQAKRCWSGTTSAGFCARSRSITPTSSTRPCCFYQKTSRTHRPKFRCRKLPLLS